MNEEFSRLYHLAWNYAESDPHYQENPTYERRCVVQSNIFAELIVSECVNIVEKLPSGYQDYRDQIEDAFRRDCVGKIKEHFEVE